MYLTIHGHFYQPPRESPWTGTIPPQEGASPHHDWNARILAECYKPNARSRVLDELGRIEEIVNNYDWIHFDFGPTLLGWLEREAPDLYREILDADLRSVQRFGGHGNAIAQAYSHPILPLSNYRDKRTQIYWGLRDFELRFGRRSESLWLPETAIDLETLRLLGEFGLRYIILSPRQARRIRPLGSETWTDVSGGLIDTRRAYRVRLRGAGGGWGAIDVFFYDGELASAVSFQHLLRDAGGFADRLMRAARGTASDALIHLATDGEVYGHHEPFADMCLAYLIAREGPLRGIKITNYGQYLDLHPPQHEVELEFGEDGGGTSWSCAHGVDRWMRDCGCSVGGEPTWNQRWRTPLRRGLEYLRERLLELYLGGTGDLLKDPWSARDDYIEILHDPAGDRSAFLEKHSRRALSMPEQARVWRLLEAQHQALLMFTSCAWFFADIGGIEVQQNLACAARAIELTRSDSETDLSETLLAHLVEAKGNTRDIPDGAEAWRKFVLPMRRSPTAIAFESAAFLAARGEVAAASSPAFPVRLVESSGDLQKGGLRGKVVVRDSRTGESWPLRIEATRRVEELLELRVADDASGEALLEGSIDLLAPGVRVLVIRELLAEILRSDQERLDAIFETSLPLLERHPVGSGILPPVFQALATDVMERRVERAARELVETTPGELTGGGFRAIVESLLGQARGIGVDLPVAAIARVVEKAIQDGLRDPERVEADQLKRIVDLLAEVDQAGIRIDRTIIEEQAYALLRAHAPTISATLAGRAEPASRVDPRVLLKLGERANLSLRSFERAPITLQ